MKQRGFTLIELMIVICIIMIVAVTILPRLTGSFNAEVSNTTKVTTGADISNCEAVPDEKHGVIYKCPDGTTIAK